MEIEDKDFESIYQGDVVSHFICKHCKERVERGVLNVSRHWVNCLERKDGLVVAQTHAQKELFDSWSINVPTKKPVNARLLTKDEVEQIWNTAKQDAAPYLSLMSEIAARSEVKGYLTDNGFKIVWEFESNPTYISAKKEVEDIFEKARKLIE
jgi:hypothetical protein